MDLLGEDLAEGAAEDREVLGEHEHLAPVDGAPAGDHAVGVRPLLEPGRVGAVAGEQVELVERALVEQVLDALAGEHLALGVLALDGSRRAGVVRLLASLAQIVELVLHRVHRSRRDASRQLATERPCRWSCAAGRRRTRRSWGPCSGRGGRGRGPCTCFAVSLAPGRLTTKACRRWPNSSSATPITAASATAGWAASRSSTSRREHVLAARHDHVVVAPVDEQPAVVVEVADVAARQQPADLLLAATARVALEPRRAADEDAADLAGRRPRCRRRRGCARRCRAPAGRPSTGRRAGRPARRPWPATPRSSRRCCRGSARSARSTARRQRRPERRAAGGDVPQRRRVVARRARRRRGPGCAAASPGTTTRPSASVARRSAASVASGSNRDCSTAVDDKPRPTPRWARPQAWNSGAAMTTVSRARIGIVSSSGVSASTPPDVDRAAPFGRPVVPDVRMT